MEVLRVLHFKVCQNQSGEILQGVVREVKEETGIHTEFEEVRTFRLVKKLFSKHSATWMCEGYQPFSCSK
uniref:Nudix hydrolase domain-containing protein n=1 Tax=Solanum tuberosum TaxID=4113 RepID=M0ZHT7_SOLTU